MSSCSDSMQTLHLQAQALLAQLHSLAMQAEHALQPTWAQHLERLEELARFLASGGTVPAIESPRAAVSPAQWKQFGQLLRDRRSAAGLSRVQLGRRAKLSDATVKFTETARHPPSRSTLLRLLGVPELQLHWSDVPGHPRPPAAQPTEEPPAGIESAERSRSLNCLLTPSYDPLTQVADLARFLNGAGGYLEQTHAYLEPDSIAAYLSLGPSGPLSTTPRCLAPLDDLAARIVAASAGAPVQMIALGAGAGIAETHLAGLLLEAGAPSLELCLLDISQPLLTCAYHHAANRLSSLPTSYVWALQGNFHDLPLYAVLHRPVRRRPRRLFTMLGGTLATLDHEPRFLQQSLLDCEPEDLLLLDVPLAAAACTEPAAIKRRDRLCRDGVPAAYAAWLARPLWRHCKEVDSVEFHVRLETRCPVPGSYALHAVAMVKSTKRADRPFSLFRFGRYDPTQLAQCLNEMGWQEVAGRDYGGEHTLRLYRKRDADGRPGRNNLRTMEGQGQ